MLLGRAEEVGRTPRGRLLACWIVVALLAGLVGAAPAAADGPAPPPFPPDPQYSAALSARIATYNSSVEALVAKGTALKTRIDDHERRRQEHQRKVDQYPNGKAPPAIARQLNAEAAAGNAERAQLQAEAEALDAEYGRLAAERAEIAAAAQNEINARVRANPPPHTAPQPGNQHAGPVRLQPPSAAANQTAPSKQSALPSPEKIAAVKKTVLAPDGKPLGREDDPGVYLISKDQLKLMHQDLLQNLGPPRIVNVQGGPIEVWELAKRCSVSYRSWSSSASEDPTIGLRIPGVPVEKYHVER